MKLKERLEIARRKLKKLEDDLLEELGENPLVDYFIMHPRIKNLYLRLLKYTGKGIDYFLKQEYQTVPGLDKKTEIHEEYEKYHQELLKRGPTRLE